MTIIFDITHPAHINLFKNSIRTLQKRDHEVYIIALNRGRLTDILNYELPKSNTKFLGQHSGSTFSILWESNLKRIFGIYLYLKRYDPDVVVTSGSIPLLIASRILGIPSLHFGDDPERIIPTFLRMIFASKLYYPSLDFNFRFFESKIHFYEGLKQWAYLAPSHFTPDNKILEEYDLISGEYIFVRDVSTSSLNYKNQESGSLVSVAKSFPNDYDVILSLENKKARGLYPDSWKILQEPVSDIHSLMYYSKAIVSTGDSMVREGAMMGVPSFYCGIRDMSANRVMKEKGMFFKVSPDEVPLKLSKLKEGNFDLPKQESFIRKLDKEWINLTDLIVKKIEKHGKE